MIKFWKTYLFVLSTIFIFYFTLPVQFYSIEKDDIISQTHFNEDDNLCILEPPDPWDPTIPAKFFISNLTKCEPGLRYLTYFQDGYVNINSSLAKPHTTCQWQCLIRDKYGYNYTKSDWYEITQKSECDVIKVQCFANSSPQNYYENMHVQVIRKKEFENSLLSSSTKYNLHIFVLDAVSRSQGIRFIPKTIKYLEQQMEAFHFPFFNKVAWNSWPNGDGFLLGKAPTKDYIPPALINHLCDNQTFAKHYIGNIFQRAGYPTLFNEDVYSMFWGIDVNSTHTITPMGDEFTKSPKYNLTLIYGDHCQTGLDYNVEMLSRFIKAYGSTSKYSLNWETKIAHDQLNYMYIEDDVLLNFLAKHQEELDNSYFILMGDHGSNVGEHRYHETVALEERNPMLYLSIPKALRQNNESQLVRNLRSNAKSIVSHYDLYATLIDIADSVGADIPIDTTVHGKSFFKPIPMEGRHCGTMGISPMYCNCRSRRAPVSRDDPLHDQIIYSIFSKMNETIANFTDICKFPTFSPKFPPIMQQIFYPGTSVTLKVFRVIFETQPDNARWETYVHVKFNHKSPMEIQNMLNLGNRLNPSGSRCSETIRDFCFCKD